VPEAQKGRPDQEQSSIDISAFFWFLRRLRVILRDSSAPSSDQFSFHSEEEWRSRLWAVALHFPPTTTFAAVFPHFDAFSATCRARTFFLAGRVNKELINIDGVLQQI